MHREIMKPPKGMAVDHIDANRADNCRANLRVCTPGEDQRNQRKQLGSASQYKGVGYLKNCKRCHAKLVFEGETVWLEHFDSEPEAAWAYDRKAVELFGEFANLNFPEEWPPERREQVRAEAKAQGEREKAEERRKKARRKNGTSSATAPSRRGRTRAKSNKTQPAKAKGRRTHHP